MNNLFAALYAETTKVMKARILWITIVFFTFLGLMMGFLMLISKNPELAGSSAILSTKASFISEASWPAYFNLLKQLALVLSVLGPGIVITWIFGREYSDRVIKDILSLPVSRINIVSAKFLVGFVWSLLLIAIMLTVAIIAGFIVKLAGFNPESLSENSLNIMVSSLLTVTLFTPVALITCISRGYLLPIGILILTMMFTQFMFVGLPGLTPYFPWSVPALYSGVAGPVVSKPGFISYFILIMTSVMGFIGTALWWNYADQH